MTEKELFTTTAAQITLSFLAQHSGESFYDKEVSDHVKLSRGATNVALRELAKNDLVIRTKKGNMVFYEPNKANPSLRQYKVFLNVLALKPLAEKLKGHALKIVLFGSSGRGEDTAQSDFDLFILTDEPAMARKLIEQTHMDRKIQAVIMKPLEWSEKQRKDAAFAAEIGRGLVLWEDLK